MEFSAKLRDWLQVEAFNDWRAIQSALLQNETAGYFGWTGYGNLGDEAVFDACKLLFKGQSVKPIRIHQPSLILERLTGRSPSLKFVALGGGTLINQSSIWLKETSYIVSKNIPMFCIGTGVAQEDSLDKPAGSDNQMLHEWVELLKRFEYAGVRGPLSQRYLSDAGLNVEVVGDTALALAPKKYKKRKIGKTIGINVSFGADKVMYGGQDTYIKNMREIVSWLLTEGFVVKILPIWKGDLEASKALYKGSELSSCQLIKAYKSVGEYMAQLEQCDLFVGQKLHATILATTLRIPSLMLEYRPKCLDYMQSMDMQDYSIRTDKINLNIFRDKLGLLISKQAELSSTLDQRVLYYRDLQHKRAKNIRVALNIN